MKGHGGRGGSAEAARHSAEPGGTPRDRCDDRLPGRAFGLRRVYADLNTFGKGLVPQSEYGAQ
ncbi:hypothetical protein GCM10018793_33320 [Streptomyces sulfonofaciens]|uniref:Uncharacterized protein n=1 Tax=Streptomyces sulfonofaciens TaxID=68272 RepID=A0A919G8M4_9ACTN|nr:hypothetical protein GCM10018793_33320 [Streptomyces sulfonofaciens]